MTIQCGRWPRVRTIKTEECKMKTIKNNLWLLTILTMVFIAGLSELTVRKAEAQNASGTPVNSVNSLATNAVLVAFKGFSTVYTINMFNSSASTVYLHVFDTNAQPADGTRPTLVPVQVPTLSTAAISYSAGRRFTNGIVAGCSSTAGTFTASTNAWFDVTFLGQ